MNSTTAFETAAQAYADGVQVLFARSGEPAGERGGTGPVDYEDLAEQAEKLAPVSAQYNEAAAERVADTSVSLEAATGLLAKALTDLEVAQYLLTAAEDQEFDLDWAAESDRERSRSRGAATVRISRAALWVSANTC